MANGVAIEDVPDGYRFQIGGLSYLYLMHLDTAGVGGAYDGVSILFQSIGASPVREGALSLARGTILYPAEA